MSYRERYAEIVKAGRRESKNIGQKAQNAVIDTFALMDEADVEIAALTEKLRAVEAERDEVQRNLALYHEVVGLIERDLGIEPMSTTKTIGGELSALRAELQRKDAALRKYADSANYSNGYYGEVTWCGAMDGEEDAPWNIARAALQPKEPPCQKA